MEVKVYLLVFGTLLILPLIHGKPWNRGEHFAGLNEEQEAVFDTFKHNLIRYYGVSESFAEQFKMNLHRAVDVELLNKKVKAGSGAFFQPRQAPLDEDEEDDEETTPSTTQGPSPFNIVNGIYGILTGVGTLNPDKVFQSTVNFFPPSQTQMAQALVDSALGKNPGTWPTTPSTTPTTTKLTTKDPDDDDDEDEDATKAVTTAVLAAVAVTGPQSATAAAAVVPSMTATLAPTIEKYMIGQKVVATQAPSIVVTASAAG